MMRQGEIVEAVGTGHGTARGVSRRAGLWLGVLLLALGALTVVPRPAQAIWVYLSEQEALDIAFPDGERVVRIDLEGLIEPKLRLNIERKAGRALVLPYMKCFQGSKDGEVEAYACIDNVIGRYRPITFMIKIDHPTGRLAWYEILVYRELVGRNSRRGPFRKQFLGKTIDSPLEYGNDIRMIAGATLTSDHLVDAFRKHFHLYEGFLRSLPIQPDLPPDHFGETPEIRVMR